MMGLKSLYLSTPLLLSQMAFSYDDSWQSFESILSSKIGIQNSWHNLIDYHKSVVNKPYWDELRSLDVVYEQVEIKDWLEQLIKTSPLPPDITALWFGITQLVIEDVDHPLYSIYLNGAETYIADEIEWAVECEYDPDNKYIIPDVLDAVENIIKTDEENYSFLSWILPLAYCAFVLEEILTKQVNKSLFLKHQSILFVTTGHDSGDYISLSPIER
jgi:hypothetical protein